MNKINLPLMHNNITDGDADVLVEFLSQRPLPIMTNHNQVRKFEKEWSEWLGVKYSVFVNSGSSANTLTMLLIKELFGEGEVITTPLGWVSDIASILHANMTPIFCDINKKTLAIDEEELIKKIGPKTKAVLLTHILGYNGMTESIRDICKDLDILLIEDCCESHGATFNGQKVGSIGDISNFSFYYAHHMTSIEGGMICTNNKLIYNMARSFRSHGMMRELDDEDLKQQIIETYPDLNPDFIFLAGAHNMRSTEINAVLASTQLKRLDENNDKRRKNLDVFLSLLDDKKYYTDFATEGNSNYALTVLLSDPDFERRDKVESVLKEHAVEFRRGMSGGGNQLRQPYLRNLHPDEYIMYPVCDYIHHFGWYVGNYPDLEEQKIRDLCELLNSI
jgi:CDP-6-deoxy-D-xylo-4-hexulose-3-dehydrase